MQRILTLASKSTVPAAFAGHGLRLRAHARGQPRLIIMAASAAAAASASSSPAACASLDEFAGFADESWLAQLTADPETAKHAPNKRSRQVKSGHYVLVAPTPLPQPSLVLHSSEMAAELGLSEAACASEAFARYFSGDVAALPSAFQTWATPYALSIMGQRQTHNCPFGNGNGYGDGRAVSVAEVQVPGGERWELQLKGGGTTPFCRGGDGRAVLRSSIREFLASEAMHHLGVPTTRALSLVVSGTEQSLRPWYSGRGDDQSPIVPSLDDPRLAQYDLPTRKQILKKLANPKSDPDIQVKEQCAITTRAAPSFMRVGHIDLHARRAEQRGGGVNAKGGPALVDIVEHAIFREYPQFAPPADARPLSARAADFLEAASVNLAALVSGWVRVGFAQGNFNADNCLVSGRTMDYGPFGWIDEYDPLFAKWTGSGEHFGFMNQPQAGFANFVTLATAVTPLLAGGENEAQAILVKARSTFTAAVDDVSARKLGMADPAAAAKRFDVLQALMRDSRADWTVCFRALSEIACANGKGATETLAPAFYEPLDDTQQAQWAAFVDTWLQALREESSDGSAAAAGARMKRENPAVVPREHLLVEAYSRASAAGDYSKVRELYQVFKDPYADPAPGADPKYYRRAPDKALTQGGTAFMS